MLLRLLKNLLHRPAIRMGRVDNRVIRTTVTRNAGFVSFVSASRAASRLHPDRHDRRLRRAKWARTVVTAALGLLSAWVALESAQALSIF